MKKHIQIAYIGGGSRQWARSLMSDLILTDDLTGTVKLYDIDFEAAKDNAIVGNQFNLLKEAKTYFHYIAVETLEEALVHADFIFISIMPHSFDVMEDYVHLPESYGIYQPVGDTTGPAGLMRALMTIPIFVDFAKEIKKHAPNAWVINLTNPLTLCVTALYHGFPQIKAYGHCHEVMHVKHLLAEIYEKNNKEKIDPLKIQIDLNGINHFTWITKAKYLDTDLVELFKKEAFDTLQTEINTTRYHEIYPFGSLNRVKFDLTLKHGNIASAGDRHLVEFLPIKDYLLSKEMIQSHGFHCTLVSFRKERLKTLTDITKQIVSGKLSLSLESSGETMTRQLRAILGIEPLITNLNLPNKGQAMGLPLNQVVETEVYMYHDSIAPLVSSRLSSQIETKVIKHMDNHLLVMEAYIHKDLTIAKKALRLDPSTEHLTDDEVNKLFNDLYNKLSQHLVWYSQTGPLS